MYIYVYIYAYIYVQDKNGRVKGIDSEPLKNLRLMLMEHLTAQHTVIALGTMHCEGGYAGKSYLAKSYICIYIYIYIYTIYSHIERQQRIKRHRERKREREG